MLPLSADTSAGIKRMQADAWRLAIVVLDPELAAAAYPDARAFITP